MLLRVLNVPMLKSGQLQTALEYSYDGEAKLSLENIQDVIETADFLRMDKLIKGSIGQRLVKLKEVHAMVPA